MAWKRITILDTDAHAGNGSHPESYRLVFEEIVEPMIREFKPQVIIRNGGSDPPFADILTQLGLTIDGFRMIGEKVRELAEVCDGREIDLIASGYNIEVLPYAWLALISGLADWKIKVALNNFSSRRTLF